MKPSVKILLTFAAVAACAGGVWSSRVVKDAVHLIAVGDQPTGIAMLGEWATQWNTSSMLKLGDRYSKEGRVAYDESESVRWYRRAAGRGDPVGQTELARAYEGGLSVPLDYALAMKWYRAAADQGYGPASNRVGWLYESGRGVAASPTDAFTWYQKSADQGSPVGQLQAGLAYMGGTGVAQDDVRAAEFFRKSAEQGWAAGQVMIGTMYSSGRGVPQDRVKAHEWLEKAAAQGYSNAQFLVGASYLNGEGVSKDEQKAYDYFLKAAQQGDGQALDAIGQLYRAPFFGKLRQDFTAAYAYFNLSAAAGDSQGKADKANMLALTPGQIAAGQSLASQWKVGDPLPLITTLEDLAPQHLFASGATAEEYAATRVWFSRELVSDGEKHYTVFLITKGTHCHACGAQLSAVTFKKQAGDRERWPRVQRYFGQVGSYGDVPESKETAAAPDAPDRIRSRDVALGGDRRLIFIDSADGGMGVEFKFVYVLAYQPQAGWRYSGPVATGERTAGEGVCDTAGPGKASRGKDLPLCYQWSGTVEVDDKHIVGGWPELLVKVDGTEYDGKARALRDANDLRYSFDGHAFVQR